MKSLGSGKSLLIYLAGAATVIVTVMVISNSYVRSTSARRVATGGFKPPRIRGITSNLSISNQRREASWKDLELHFAQIYRILPRSGYDKSMKNPCWWVNTTFQYQFHKSYYSKKFMHAYHEMGVHQSSKYLQTLLLQKKAPTLLCLPYFLIIGMPKCGTTDLYQRIIQHPQVIAPASKEPHWWSKRRREAGGPTFLDYLFLFSMPAKTIRTNRDMITGEGSASTMFYNTGNDSISNAKLVNLVLPHAKILVILQNPINRLYSEYLDFVCRKRDYSNCSSSDFHERVERAILSFEACTSRKNSLVKQCVNLSSNKWFGVRLHLGLYHEFLQPWSKWYPLRKQLLILSMEDYSNHLTANLNKVFHFLDLAYVNDTEMSTIASLPIQNANTKLNTQIGPMLQKTRDLLKKFYTSYNERLAAFTQDDKFLWS